MTGFIRRVRKVLDETSRGGKRRWLCARVPCYVSGFDPLGIDLRAWADAGLDMVNLSPSFFAVQQTDLLNRARHGAGVGHLPGDVP